LDAGGERTLARVVADFCLRRLHASRVGGGALVLGGAAGAASGLGGHVVLDVLVGLSGAVVAMLEYSCLNGPAFIPVEHPFGAYIALCVPVSVVGSSEEYCGSLCAQIWHKESEGITRSSRRRRTFLHLPLVGRSPSGHGRQHPHCVWTSREEFVAAMKDLFPLKHEKIL